jgi:hypothetical protein
MKKTLLVFVLIGLLSSSFILAAQYEVKGKAGEYNVQVVLDKSPPARGRNNLEITVTDAASKPVTDAQVHVEYLMPSLPGRTPMMEYSTTGKPSGHNYLAQMDLSMAGKWTVVVKVTHGKETGAMEFTFVVE